MSSKDEFLEGARLMYHRADGQEGREEGLLLMYSVFAPGNLNALEELSELLGMYSEHCEPGEKERVVVIAEAAEKLHEGLQRISSYMLEIAQRHEESRAK